MHHLFIARHADYGSGDRITGKGREQMRRLGDAIREIVEDGSVVLVTSTAQRAKDSAETLAAELDLGDYVPAPYLWSGSDAPAGSYYHDRDQDKLMNLVQTHESEASGLVLVTHLEVVQEFPPYFIQRRLGRRASFDPPRKGSAVHVDTVRGRYETLP